MNERTRTWLSIGAVLLALVALAAVAWATAFQGYGSPEVPEARSTYGCAVYTEQGCAKFVVASGGEVEVQSGGTLDIQSGATTDFSGGIDVDGALLDLDADGDTSIQADTDDQIDIEIAGADDFQFTANTFTALAGSSIVNNGTLDQNNNIDLDGAADEVQLAVTGYTTQTSDLVQLDGGLVDIGGGSYDTADGDNDLGVAGDLEVDGVLDADSTADFAGAVTFQSTLNQALNLENVGMLPTVITATVVYTPASGTVATIGDGEIWLVVDVFYNVATNFDCTGDDCTVDVGDGSDADGLLNCADADVQTTYTDYTGSAAGWGGLDGSAPSGAYNVGGPHIYAPSGSAETIDYAIGGTDPAAGSMTVYVVYYRLQ